MSKADEDPAGEEQRAAQESHQTSEWGGSVKDVNEADDVNEVEEDDDVQDSVYDDEEGGAVSDLPAMSLIKPPTRQAGMPAYRYPVAEINASIFWIL